MNKRGYTLVEVLVCLALLGLLAGISVAPAVGKQRAKQTLTSTAICFANDLRASRFSAMAEGRAYQVEVFATNYTVSVVVPGKWQVVKRVYWPNGVKRVGSLYIKFSFPSTGLFKEFDNNTVAFKDDYNRTIKVVVSSGGRIRLE